MASWRVPPGARSGAVTLREGIGPERRHTVGMKWTGSGARLTLNYDVLLQWGTFSGAPIRAFAFATETGYQLTMRGWRPRLGLRMDLASGDRNAAHPTPRRVQPALSRATPIGSGGPARPHQRDGPDAHAHDAARRGVTLVSRDPELLADIDRRRRGTARTSACSSGPDTALGRYVGSNPGVLVDWAGHPPLSAAGRHHAVSARRLREEHVRVAGFGFYSASAVYRF